MSLFPQALWLNVSPSLHKFDQPLLKHLSCELCLGVWAYCHTPDEPLSLKVPLILLHDYIKRSDRPIHLIGHSTSGLIGLLYAHRYPERVKSLTLLGVGVNPAVDWQAHYYVQLQMLPCSREIILLQMANTLFDCQVKTKMKNLVKLLEEDLVSSVSPHTLFDRADIPPVKVSVPLLVCGSRDDMVVDINQLRSWSMQLSEQDRIWECPAGKHFFHYVHPKLVSEQILNFWQTLPLNSVKSKI